ncbi:hypothetical protein V8C35DRAFT_290614 [Trichoderma chlorosporum]
MVLHTVRPIGDCSPSMSNHAEIYETYPSSNAAIAERRRYQSYQVLSEIVKSRAEFPHAARNAAHPVHTTVNVVPHAGSTASTLQACCGDNSLLRPSTGRRAAAWDDGNVKFLWSKACKKMVQRASKGRRIRSSARYTESRPFPSPLCLLLQPAAPWALL